MTPRQQRLADLLTARARLDREIQAIDPRMAWQVPPAPRRKSAHAEHGTDSGYYRHRRRPGPGWDHIPCRDCLAAHAAAERTRRLGATA